MNFGRRNVVAALGVVCLQALLLALVHAPVLGSDLLLEASSVLACLACWQRSRVVAGAARWKWTLIAGGICIWCVGQAITTFNEGLLHLLQQAPTAIDSDYYFFLFGMPLLLVMSSADERRKINAVLLIDGLQASIAVYLVHLQLFPGGGATAGENAISAVRMMNTYNVENVVLAGIATLRLSAKPSGEERNIYRVLAIFMAVYAVVAGYLNRLIVVNNLQTGTFYDLLWDLPFVVLVWLVTRLPSKAEAERASDQAWAGLLVNNASPVFFTMALLVLGVSVERHRAIAGMAAITFALVSYGLRSSLVQSYAMRTERKLLESEAALVKANEQLEELSFLDRLTGVPNRRRFEEALTVEWNRTRRARVPMSLLVIDIDHFKLLNDRYGHLNGDECLIKTAQVLSGCLQRAGELLARYGGEEFVAVLPSLDEEHAFAVAERMRRAVEGLSLANADAPGGRMTVSIGVASANESLLRPAELFDAADRALYQAKAGGRNRVEVFGNDGADMVDGARLLG